MQNEMISRVNKIRTNEAYQRYLCQNEKAEKDRIFCHHDMGHFLDVARIAWILNLEEDYQIQKELIYAVALLHDIGRFRQYEDGTPHEQASAKLAPQILEECGFTKEETALIVEAISQHRNSAIRQDKDLNGLLYRADKLSRACFSCKAEKDCNWKNDKKNQILTH